MVHISFYRPGEQMHVWTPDHKIWRAFNASGDAWGSVMNPEGGPYGQYWPAPPGHYLLSTIDVFPEIPSEGSVQIHVTDIDQGVLRTLVNAKKASIAGVSGREGMYDVGALVDIGGIIARIGQLEQYGRDAIMLHGGGSDLGEPACYAPQQKLTKTEGCTRMHNADIQALAAWLREQRHSNTIIYSIIGDPVLLDE